jgi:hypothetical protein
MVNKVKRLAKHRNDGVEATADVLKSTTYRCIINRESTSHNS